MSNKQESNKSCQCKPTWDVRCTCWVPHSSFKHCPQKIPTTYYRIMNEYDLYKKMGNGHTIDNIKAYIMKVCDLTDQEWIELREMLEEDFEENNRETDSD